MIVGLRVGVSVEVSVGVGVLVGPPGVSGGVEVIVGVTVGVCAMVGVTPPAPARSAEMRVANASSPPPPKVGWAPPAAPGRTEPISPAP
ncbi:MAG: hypothetical protein ABR576_06220 [Thermoanaerobaculia bacterium]